MVRTCCVERCKRTSRPGDNVSFFSFPLQNQDLLNKWLEIIPTKNRISEYTQICSTHFEESQYRCMNGRRYLKKDAIPSIFPFDLKIHKTSKEEDKILRCQQNTSKHMSNNIRNHYDSHCNMQKQEITNTSLSSTLNTVDKAIQSTPRTQSIAIQVPPKQLAQSENEKNLRQQIKILQNKLRYRELRMSNVCQLIKQLKRKA
ncbi:THAP domain-containing protein 1 [Camponotus japonicus]